MNLPAQYPGKTLRKIGKLYMPPPNNAAKPSFAQLESGRSDMTTKQLEAQTIRAFKACRMDHTTSVEYSFEGEAWHPVITFPVWEYYLHFRIARKEKDEHTTNMD